MFVTGHAHVYETIEAVYLYMKLTDWLMSMT